MDRETVSEGYSSLSRKRTMKTLAKTLEYNWRLSIYLAAILGALVFVVGNDWIQDVTFFLVAPVLLFAL